MRRPVSLEVQPSLTSGFVQEHLQLTYQSLEVLTNFVLDPSPPNLVRLLCRFYQQVEPSLQSGTADCHFIDLTS